MKAPSAVSNHSNELVTIQIEAQRARLAAIRKERAIERFLDANFVVGPDYVGWRRRDFDLIARFFETTPAPEAVTR